MNILLLSLVIALLSACGKPDPDPSSTASASLTSQVQNESTHGASGTGIGAAQAGETACEYFEKGIIARLFDVANEDVSYRRSIPVKRAGHVLCMATWDKPEKAELEAAYQRGITEWTRSLASGGGKPQPKYPATTNEVSVTLMADKYDTPKDAATSLESSVASLSKGFTVEAAGRKREVKTEFGDWIEGIGDRAIFTDKGSLMVAWNSRRMTIAVSVSEDKEINQEKAIALARTIMGD